jgi:sarcosine oxidase subunit beta
MRETADVIVIGAGIVGLSVAHQISRRDPRRIIVLDKASNVAEGSTGASSAILRQRYTHHEAVVVARDGLRCHRAWAAYTGLEEPRARFHASGVLWMMGESRERVEHDRDRMVALAIDAALLDAAEVRGRFPALSTCNEPFDMTGETEHRCVDHDSFLFEADGGFFDPVSAAQDLRDVVRGAGVDIRFGAEVSSIRAAGGRIEGVGLADGGSIDAPVVVNASGPWAARVARMAGLEWNWTIRPIRAQVIYREWPRDIVPGPLPVVGDSSSGIYLRPEASGQQILLGSILHEDEQEVVEDPDRFNNNLDASFRDAKIHALHHRIPSLPHRGRITGLAGMYTMNVEDVHPIVGPTEIEGFIVANGFSGHGFKESPAVGSMIARHITGAEPDEWDTEAPMEFFSIDRDPIELPETTVLA